MTFDLLWCGQICVPLAVAILEECCMAFANTKWLFSRQQCEIAVIYPARLGLELAVP